MADEYPVAVFLFGVEVGNKLSGYFTKVSGLGGECEVVKHRYINPETYEIITLMVPGGSSWTPIILSRGLTGNGDIWTWYQQVLDDIEDARTNCSIIAYGPELVPVARWDLEEAWPSKITVSDMDASGKVVAVEEVTIVHEGMTRVE